MCLITTRILPSPLSPVCACGGLPHPRSNSAHEAATRAISLWPFCAMPASDLMLSSVCPRASDRKSAGILFRGNCLRGGPTPSCSRRYRTRVRRGVNGANCLTRRRLVGRTVGRLGEWRIGTLFVEMVHHRASCVVTRVHLNARCGLVIRCLAQTGSGRRKNAPMLRLHLVPEAVRLIDGSTSATRL
jgi:hypothetical protein